MRTKTILIRARDLIAKPDGWCQARDHKKFFLADGTVKHQYCARGAIHAVTKKNTRRQMRAEHALVVGANLRYESIIGFNDSPIRRQADVVRAFDKAIGAL